MSSKPRVSAVIPCRNEAAHIETCLTAVLNQHAPDGGFEVVIADGMSDDGSREILKKLEGEVGGQRSEVRGQKPEVGVPVIRVIDNPGRIVSTGLNTAISAARGNIIIRMDAHTEYAPDYICRCVAALTQTGADNVGGPWVASGDTFMSRAIAAAFQSPFAVGGARSHQPDHEGEVDSVYLGCWRKESFAKFGYFDEELVRNQDDEHNLRIIRGGGQIYQSPKIKSWYRPRGSLASLFRQYLQYGYWKVRVIQKHKLPASWRHIVPGAFVLTLTLLFLLSTFSFLLPALRFPLSIFSFQVSAFSFVFLIALSAYVSAVFAASVITAARTEWKLLPILPLVFPCYHFGYGIGFLRGIWDFAIRRKGAHKNFEVLTR